MFSVKKRKFLVLILGVLLCCAVQSGAQAKPSSSTPEETFGQQVKSYEDMVNGLPAQKLKPTSNPRDLEKRRVALRLAIQHARATAKQGDIFATDCADAIRKMIADTMAGPDGAKIRTSLKHAEPGASSALTVNGIFPNVHGQPLQSMPGSLLRKLPALPKGLEYRIAGSNLALRDTEANLVVDYLPNAIQ